MSLTLRDGIVIVAVIAGVLALMLVVRLVAGRLGINPDNLVFSIDVSTANGRALAAPVTLREVAIGPIARGTIRGMVTEQGRLEQSLLGMSFLETLGSIEITRDELRLKD